MAGVATLAGWWRWRRLGGFDVEKIRLFAEQHVPVDSYGVGSSLFKNSYDFTADVVLREGKPVAKAGRDYRPNPRLERVD